MLVGREVGWLWEEGEESGGLGDGFVRGMVQGKWNGGAGGERGKKRGEGEDWGGPGKVRSARWDWNRGLRHSTKQYRIITNSNG